MLYIHWHRSRQHKATTSRSPNTAARGRAAAWGEASKALRPRHHRARAQSEAHKKKRKLYHHHHHHHHHTSSLRPTTHGATVVKQNTGKSKKKGEGRGAIWMTEYHEGQQPKAAIVNILTRNSIMSDVPHKKKKKKQLSSFPPFPLSPSSAAVRPGHALASSSFRLSPTLPVYMMTYSAPGLSPYSTRCVLPTKNERARKGGKKKRSPFFRPKAPRPPGGRDPFR